MFEIKRKILQDLINHLEKPEVSLIVGPRQAGKTTIMLLLKDYLEKMGENTLFLNLDNENDSRYFHSQQNLLAKLNLEFGNKKGFVFIDEIQRKENAGIFLKGIYDSRIPHKLIVSGSGSIELKEKIHESMTGRKLLFHLDTLSFKEFLNFRTDYKYVNKLIDFCKIEEGVLINLFSEYINFGGYPRVVLSKTEEEKTRIIDEIYNSYLIKDLSFLLKVEKIEAIGNLFKVLSAQIGQLINYSELCSVIGISQETLKNYLYYGQKTFVINKISPFYKNPRKEIIKAPMIYFTDIGLRNYCATDFGRITKYSASIGFVFQNLVYMMLKNIFRYKNVNLSFWRSKDKAEVDFVIDKASDLLPVDVKYKKMDKPQVAKSLRNFIAKYSPKQALIVNLTLEQTQTINRTEIKFIPFWRLLEFDTI